MKKLITILSIFLISILTLSGLNLFAAINYNPGSINDPAAPYENVSFKTDAAYTIFLPGKEKDGKKTAGKIFNIEKLAPEHYLPNTFHVKTKSRLSVGPDKKSIGSAILQKSIEDLNITNIFPLAGETPGDEILSGDRHGVTRIYEVSYDSPVDPYDVCMDLMNNPDVEYAVPVFKRYTTDFVPNDPDYKSGKQYGLKSMNLEKAWGLSKGSPDILIAIVDSGTEIDHSDLKDNIWTNPGEIPGNGKDDDDNGKIDDVNGWDMVGNISQNDIFSGNYKEDNDPENRNNFHGTFCAGCASAVTNNNIGIASPGFYCSILPVKCATDQNVNGIFRGYSGILYAAQTGADIINCSWGGPGSSPAEQDIINQAVEMGALVVVASGNDGMNIDDGGQYPAGYENVLSVGATRTNNRLASFTNTGFKVGVYAPGQSIYSTSVNNRYSTQNGTSFACPYTAGVAGLIKALHPEWTPKQLWHQLRGTVDNVLTSNPDIRHLYFGQVNAFQAVYKNMNESAPQMPGIEAYEIQFSGLPYLNNFEPKDVDMKITNYLADASNLKVTIKPLSPYITISKETENIGSLPGGGEYSLDMKITLHPSNPWYEGSANVLLIFEADNYYNEQVMPVPIKIPSENKFVSAVTFPESYTPFWHYAHSSDASTFWAVASGGFFGNNFGAMRLSSGQAQYVTVPNYSYTIFSFDGLKAYTASSPQSGGAAIHRTTNGGGNWTNTPVGDFADFINQIHFFDEDNGIFLGDVKGGKFAVGKTTNGGQTWTRLTSQSAPLPDEEGWVGANYWIDDHGWFGTTKGRIYRSTNRGDIWQASNVYDGAHVHYIGFKDKMNGIAVYTEEYNGNVYKCAATTNGGFSWTPGVYNFTENNLRPVYIFAPDNSKMIFVQHLAGEVYGTSDNGKSWEPVLSEKSGIIMKSAGISLEDSKARLWNFGAGVSYLDFYYRPDNELKKLTLQTQGPLDFDTVEVGRSKTESVIFINESNVPLGIKSYEVIPEEGTGENEFNFLIKPPDELGIGSNMILRLRFEPKSSGLKKAKMRVTADMESGGIYDLDLVGVGDNASSVDYEILETYVSVSPNPGSGSFHLAFGLKQSSPVEIKIYNSAGYEVFSKDIGFLNNGSHNYPVQLSNLPSGSYFYELSAGSEKLAGSFVIAK